MTENNVRNAKKFHKNYQIMVRCSPSLTTSPFLSDVAFSLQRILMFVSVFEQVENHKTAASYARTVLVLSATELSWLKDFGNLRPQLPGFQFRPSTFFFTAEGNPVSMVGEALSKAWQHTGLRSKITPGMLRAAVATYEPLIQPSPLRLKRRKCRKGRNTRRKITFDNRFQRQLKTLFEKEIKQNSKCKSCARSRGAWPEPRGRGLPPPLGRHPLRCGLTNAGWPLADTPEGAVILPRDCACCCGGALRHWHSCGHLGWKGLLGHIFANCCEASRALTERCSISSTAGPNVCPGEIGASSNGTLSGSCTLACESQSCLLATTRDCI
ncbi:UNVERIFIED_CONTAM: hypothetical protein FKN15_062066 [Acipenser sinensis]